MPRKFKVSCKKSYIPSSHKKELDKRLLKYKSDPGNLLSLEQLQERIEARK
jgi:putative addiction module component (TIGR02574 family)